MKKDIINGIKKLLTGNLFLAGICEAGAPEVQERIKLQTQKKKEEIQNNFKQKKEAYLEMFGKANSICDTKPDYTKWTIKNLQLVLPIFCCTYISTKKNENITSKKANLAATYEVWRTRSPIPFREYLEIKNTILPEGESDDLHP